MKNDRFFLFIIGGIATIVILSFIIVLTNQDKVSYLPDDSPEGVANNYILAWVDGNYETIEKYLVEDEHKPEIDKIIDTVNENQYSLKDVGVSIDKTTVYGNKATITITIMHSGNSYDYSRYDSSDTISLIEQDGKWKIKESPYPFWGWDWYQSSEETGKY